MTHGAGSRKPRRAPASEGQNLPAAPPEEVGVHREPPRPRGDEQDREAEVDRRQLVGGAAGPRIGSPVRTCIAPRPRPWWQPMPREASGVSTPRIQAMPPPNSERAARPWKRPGMTKASGPIHPKGFWIFPQPWKTKARPATSRISSRAPSAGGGRWGALRHARRFMGRSFPLRVSRGPAPVQETRCDIADLHRRVQQTAFTSLSPFPDRSWPAEGCLAIVHAKDELAIDQAKRNQTDGTGSSQPGGHHAGMGRPSRPRNGQGCSGA